MLNLRGVSHPSLFKNLVQSVQLVSLQLLNLNYCFSEGEIQKEARFLPSNFPQLKELFFRGNHIRSLTLFTALSKLKLLDLAQNKINRINEAEFPENLVVLNVIDNNLIYDQKTLKALSMIKIVNPDDICRISCFQNFRQLALGDPADYKTNS